MHGQVVVKESVQVPIMFFFFNTFFSAIIRHICAELNDYVGKKNPFL